MRGSATDLFLIKSSFIGENIRNARPPSNARKRRNAHKPAVHLPTNVNDGVPLIPPSRIVAPPNGSRLANGSASPGHRNFPFVDAGICLTRFGGAQFDAPCPRFGEIWRQAGRLSKRAGKRGSIFWRTGSRRMRRTRRALNDWLQLASQAYSALVSACRPLRRQVARRVPARKLADPPGFLGRYCVRLF